MENVVEDRNDTLEAHLKQIDGKIDTVLSDVAQLRIEMKEGFRIAHKRVTKSAPKFLWGGIPACAFLVAALCAGYVGISPQRSDEAHRNDATIACHPSGNDRTL
jgi:hypothetical protein